MKKLNKAYEWNLPGDYDRFPEELPEIATFREEFLNKMFKNQGPEIQNDILLSMFQEKWNILSGPLSRHSFPESVKANKIFITVDHSTYAQEIKMHENSIMSLAKRNGLPVLKIITRIGTVIRSSPAVVLQKERSETDDFMNEIRKVLQC